MILDIAFIWTKCNSTMFIYDKNNSHPTSKKDIDHIGCSYCGMIINRMVKEE